MLLAEACFAGIGAVVKFTSGTASEVQVVFFRNFFALLLMLPFLYKHGFSLLKTQRWYLHLSRALTGLISMYCFFYVLARLPLAQLRRPGQQRQALAPHQAEQGATALLRIEPGQRLA